MPIFEVPASQWTSHRELALFWATFGALKKIVTDIDILQEWGIVLLASGMIILDREQINESKVY